jgi:hypothetical protein
LISTLVVAVRFPQGPSAAIKAICAFVPPFIKPGFPPVATKYTSVVAVGHAYSPVRLNAPELFVVTADVSSGVAVEPSPPIPAA